MYTLYTAQTPNGRKISVMLEELGVSFTVVPVSFAAGEQKRPDYVKLNPNGRIPTLLDHEAGEFPVFESGAILHYLADKHGRFLPPANDPKGRSVVMQWLMFQMAGVGPMMGQAGVFYRYAEEKIPFAINRYQNETKRLFGVLDERLGKAEYLAGDYSIADMATYPWIVAHPWIGVTLDGFDNLKRWVETVGERPAVKAGMTIPSETVTPEQQIAQARSILTR
jgi:GST-like protein